MHSVFTYVYLSDVLIDVRPNLAMQGWSLPLHVMLTLSIPICKRAVQHRPPHCKDLLHMRTPALHHSLKNTKEK